MYNTDVRGPLNVLAQIGGGSNALPVVGNAGFPVSRELYNIIPHEQDRHGSLEHGVRRFGQLDLHQHRHDPQQRVQPDRVLRHPLANLISPTSRKRLTPP